MTNPYITSRIAEQHIQDLLRHAEQDRLRRTTGKQQPHKQPGRDRWWFFLLPVPRPRNAIA
jgi:hypothetical protein